MHGLRYNILFMIYANRVSRKGKTWTYIPFLADFCKLFPIALEIWSSQWECVLLSFEGINQAIFHHGTAHKVHKWGLNISLDAASIHGKCPLIKGWEYATIGVQEVCFQMPHGSLGMSHSKSNLAMSDREWAILKPQLTYTPLDP